MSVCQRKTGYWLVKFKDAESGQWKQRQFKTQAEAEEFDSKAKLAVAREEPLSLRDAIGAYIQRRPLCQTRINSYVRIVGEGGPAHSIADCYVEELTRRDLEAVRSFMRSLEFKTRTINYYVDMLKAVMNWCASEDLIRQNPWAKYKALPGGVAEHRTGTVEELRALYPHLPSWLQWAVRTTMALCLRPGIAEVFSLTWDAFDWRCRTVTVYMPKTQRTKTAFIPEWYLEEAKNRSKIDSERGLRVVCRGLHDQRIRSSTAYFNPWKAACRKGGVDIPFYAIRHIAASEMLAAGADLAAVAAQLGHRDISTTAAFYTHAVARAQKAAAAAIPTLGEGFGGRG